MLGGARSAPLAGTRAARRLRGLVRRRLRRRHLHRALGGSLPAGAQPGRARRRRRLRRAGARRARRSPRARRSRAPTSRCCCSRPRRSACRARGPTPRSASPRRPISRPSSSTWKASAPPPSFAVLGRERFTLRSFEPDARLVALLDARHRVLFGSPSSGRASAARPTRGPFSRTGSRPRRSSRASRGGGLTRGLHSALDSRSRLDEAALDASVAFLLDLVSAADARNL